MLGLRRQVTKTEKESFFFSKLNKKRKAYKKLIKYKTDTGYCISVKLKNHDMKSDLRN